MIKVYIIDIRNNAISRDLIDKNLEPFSIEAKEFYELSKVSILYKKISLENQVINTKKKLLL
jgi:hypothetical protein